MTEERRQARRTKASLYAIWDLTTQSVASGHATDFSLAGCFVQSHNGLPTKPALSIQFRTPTERWLEVRGEVARVGGEDGFGVCFTWLSDEDKKMLELLEEYYEAEQL